MPNFGQILEGICAGFEVERVFSRFLKVLTIVVHGIFRHPRASLDRVLASISVEITNSAVNSLILSLSRHTTRVSNQIH